MSTLEGLTQEQMVELAKQVNSGASDPNVSDQEREARQAAASLASGAPQGSQNADEIVAGQSAPTGEDQNQDAPQVADAQAAAGEQADAEAQSDGQDTDDQSAVADEKPFPVSDDIHLNSALKILKAAGLSADDLGTHFSEAFKTGDISSIDQEALKEAIGEDNAVLAMAGVSQWSAGAGSAALAAAREIHQSVGGSGNWSKMTTWAKEMVKADPGRKAEITEITEMLNGNATARKLGAAEFKRIFNADPKNVTVGSTEVISKGTSSVTVAAATPLTSAQAFEAKDKLYRQRQLGKVNPQEFNKRLAEIKRGQAAQRAL